MHDVTQVVVVKVVAAAAAVVATIGVAIVIAPTPRPSPHLNNSPACACDDHSCEGQLMRQTDATSDDISSGTASATVSRPSVTLRLRLALHPILLSAIAFCHLQFLGIEAVDLQLLAVEATSMRLLAVLGTREVPFGIGADRLPFIEPCIPLLPEELAGTTRWSAFDLDPQLPDIGFNVFAAG